jgi:hypothetical protein
LHSVLAAPNSLTDHIEHPLDIPKHIVIPKSQHTVTVRFEILRAPPIAHALCMLAAVDFDDDAGLVTGEVREVRTDRRLAAKVRAAWRELAQGMPEFFLGVGWIVAKRAGTRDAMIDGAG